MLYTGIFNLYDIQNRYFSCIPQITPKCWFRWTLNNIKAEIASASGVCVPQTPCYLRFYTPCQPPLTKKLPPPLHGDTLFKYNTCRKYYKVYILSIYWNLHFQCPPHQYYHVVAWWFWFRSAAVWCHPGVSGLASLICVACCPASRSRHKCGW